MNPPTTQTPTLPLDPATLAAMHSTTFDALPPRPGASDAQKAAQRDGAVAFLAALLPRDPVQVMLAALDVSSDHHNAFAGVIFWLVIGLILGRRELAQ